MKHKPRRNHNSWARPSIPIPEQLRDWRGYWKLTRAQAAGALAVSLRSIENWEQGTRRPRGLALELLKTKLQNPPD